MILISKTSHLRILGIQKFTYALPHKQSQGPILKIAQSANKKSAKVSMNCSTLTLKGREYRLIINLKR